MKSFWDCLMLLPVASELHATAGGETLRTFLISATRITVGILLPFACILAFLSRQLITVWVGPQYASASAVAITLLVACVVGTAAWPAGTVLQAMSRHKLLAAASIMSAAANVLLSIVLLRHFGMIGVALGTLIPAVLEIGCFTFPYTFRLVGVRPRTVVTEVVRPLAMPTLNMATALWIITTYFTVDSAGGIVLTGGAAGLVYAGTYWVTGHSTPERRLCADVAASALRHAGALTRSA
jgi:O-antigen/teichoic acid export membrane protein